MRGRLPLLLLHLGFLFLVPGCIPLPPTLQPAAPDLMKHSVTYLASPELAGRGMGAPGLDHAAHYLAGYFQGLGLRPPPSQDSFIQPFTITYVTAPANTTSLSLDNTPYTPSTDFIPSRYSAEGAFDASIGFVGYGITAQPSAPAYDDYAGVNLTGKIALALALEPHDEKGSPRLGAPRSSGRDSSLRKAQLAASHGAVAILLVHPPTHPSKESLPTFRRRLEQPSSQSSPIPIFHITQKTADDLLRHAGAKPLKTYAQSINSALAPRSFALRNIRLQGSVAFARQTHTLKNVAACLKGRGPLANQYIVIGAHYDHLGLADSPSTTAPTTRPYYPGADDNASGTAAVLELARLFAQASRPARSILFVAFSGEEAGLLGSKHWVDNPPVPLNKIVAMINLDMLGRLRENTLTVGGTTTAAPFPQILANANNPAHLKFRYTWNNGIAPSDNTPFAQKRIPVLFFITGSHPDLHRTSDTPDKINYPGQAQVTNLIANTIRALTIEKNLSFTDSPPTTRPTTRP